MPILKNKVSRALRSYRAVKDKNPTKVKEEPINTPSPSSQVVEEFSSQRQRRTRQATQNKSPVQKPRSSPKNIVKNYGRAFASFALSNISHKFLNKLLEEKQLSLAKFKEFVLDRREGINGISTLRDMLLIQNQDTNDEISCKEIFKQLSIVFLKFFSVNWIFESKIDDKIAHLKCRFKMIRRVKNPEFFTYLQTSD